MLGLILLQAIFRRGNPSVVALVRAGTVACPYSSPGKKVIIHGKTMSKTMQIK
jgi:hypothetical protein